ncbi:MAG: CYTH domain-containing protein [Bacteroidetes bacterium]|nr:CYTH domain-containing protein [Bacteroidota bacterium]
MGKEIERKFLVHTDKWQALTKPEGHHYRQGYLLTDPYKTIRVRVTPTTAFLTIKGLSVGATRTEYEYEIPADEATELLDQFSLSELEKTRCHISMGQHTWEVDVFAGDNAGLIVAEIELTGEEETFPIPEWIADEVTGEDRYYNSNLTIHPFKNWDI